MGVEACGGGGSTELPGFAVRTGLEAGVGRVVVEEPFLIEVEGEAAAEAEGDIGDMAEGIAADGLVDGADGWGAAADAVEEVAGMVAAAGELNGELLGLEVEEGFGLQVDAAAVDVGPAVGAFERGAMGGDAPVALSPGVPVQPGFAGGGIAVAAVGDAHELEGEAAGEAVIDFPDGGGVADAVGESEVAASLDGDGALHEVAGAPEGDIDGVDAPAGDEAEGVIGDEPPRFLGSVVAAAVLGMGLEGGGAEPEVVIESWWGWGDSAGAARGAAGCPDVDVLEGAEGTVAGEFAGEAEEAAGALLGAELEDPLAALDRGAEGLSFGEG